MSRNSSGVYTLPSAAFVTQTTIQADPMNADLLDIATALTGSLPVNGSAPMTGPLVLAAGTALLPSLIFTGNPATGLYLIDVNTFGITVAGVLCIRFNAAGTVTYNRPQVYSATQTYNAIQVSNPVASSINLGTSQLALAQCRMTLAAGVLKLAPFGGNLLFVNSQNYVIPAAGITINNGTTVLSTVYYIYAAITGGVMALEASTTGYTIDSTYGFAFKTGDTTRTLVGMAKTTAGNAWADTDGNMLVLSYFNRRRKRTLLGLTSVTTAITSDGALHEIDSNLRNTFMTWADEVVTYRVSFVMGVFTYNTGAGGTCNCYIGIDSAGAANIGANTTTNNNAAVNNGQAISTDIMYMEQPTEGVSHFISMLYVSSSLLLGSFTGNNAGATVNYTQSIVEVYG